MDDIETSQRDRRCPCCSIFSKTHGSNSIKSIYPYLGPGPDIVRTARSLGLHIYSVSMEYLGRVWGGNSGAPWP